LMGIGKFGLQKLESKQGYDKTRIFAGIEKFISLNQIFKPSPG